MCARVHQGARVRGTMGVCARTPRRKKKCSLFPVVCCPSAPLHYLSQIYMCPKEKNRPSRGQALGEPVLLAAACACVSSLTSGGGPQLQAGGPSRACGPPLLVLSSNTEHHSPRQPAPAQCLSCRMTKSRGTGRRLHHPCTELALS